MRLSMHALWLAILLTCACVQSGQAQECTAGAWALIADGAFHREGCVKGKRYVTVAVDQAKYVFGLAGSGPNGVLPKIEEVQFSTDASGAANTSEAVSTSEAADTSGGAKRFSLGKFVSEAPDLLTALVVGYPADEEIFVLDGFARIDGEDVSERDTAVAFKSAMLCLDDTSDEVSRLGSRPIVFNAFENRTPVELNDRVADPEICRDVIQVGPRIVEYRSVKGIKPGAKRDIPQRYTVFSLGTGPGFYAYFTVFLDKVVLTDVQDMLLSDPSFLNDDRKTLVAVTLTSDKYSAMAIRESADIATNWATQGEGHIFYGDTERSSPVFLTIRKAALQ